MSSKAWLSKRIEYNIVVLWMNFIEIVIVQKVNNSINAYTVLILAEEICNEWLV